MKRKRITTKITVAAILTGLLLAGCGSSAAYEKNMGSSRDYYDEPAMAMTEEAYYDTDDVYESEEMDDYSGETGTTEGENAEILNENSSDSSRKLIKNVNLEVETEEFDRFIANVEHKVNALGGYIENSTISGRSLYNTYDNRNASITARVPNDKLNDFVTAVTEQSNITSKSLSTEDVTLQYADTKAHIESLKSEQERLNDLIKQAEDLDTLLTLEARLTEVSYQIESYERQIRSMDNKVDYATIYLYVEEVTHYTPVQEEPLSAGERISRGLSENLYRIGHGFSEFGIGFVIALPFILLTLIIVGLIALVIVLIVKAIIRRVERSNARRQARMANAPAQGRAAPVSPVPNAPGKQAGQTSGKPEEKH
ncbi:MAG: DUF4349 domain-containing protein [Lachnospiraceae bacterium]|nr:DUF4349 domain-containing protein [Lachnospiraceae bacterium]